MIVTNDLIKSFNPCKDGYKYWRSVALPDLVEFMRRAHADGHSGLANWLFCRVAPREIVVKYASNAARSVIHLFDSAAPSDRRRRAASNGIGRGEVPRGITHCLWAERAAHSAAASHSDAAAHCAAHSSAAAHSAVAAHCAAHFAASYATALSSRAEKWGEILEFGISLLEKWDK